MALIKTLQPDYKWIGNKSDIEKMIGNAVPVNLAVFIGKTIKSVIEE